MAFVRGKNIPPTSSNVYYYLVDYYYTEEDGKKTRKQRQKYVGKDPSKANDYLKDFEGGTPWEEVAKDVEPMPRGRKAKNDPEPKKEAPKPPTTVPEVQEGTMPSYVLNEDELKGMVDRVPKDAYTVQEMTPDEFLRLTNANHNFKDDFNFSENKYDRLNEAFDNGDELPPLRIKVNTDFGLETVNHDGRHRAAVAKERGIKKVPVLVMFYTKEKAFPWDKKAQWHYATAPKDFDVKKVQPQMTDSDPPTDLSDKRVFVNGKAPEESPKEAPVGAVSGYTGQYEGMTQTQVEEALLEDYHDNLYSEDINNATEEPPIYMAEEEDARRNGWAPADEKAFSEKQEKMWNTAMDDMGFPYRKLGFWKNEPPEVYKKLRVTLTEGDKPSPLFSGNYEWPAESSEAYSALKKYIEDNPDRDLYLMEERFTKDGNSRITRHRTIGGGLDTEHSAFDRYRRGNKQEMDDWQNLKDKHKNESDVRREQLVKAKSALNDELSEMNIKQRYNVTIDKDSTNADYYDIWLDGRYENSDTHREGEKIAARLSALGYTVSDNGTSIRIADYSKKGEMKSIETCDPKAPKAERDAWAFDRMVKVFPTVSPPVNTGDARKDTAMHFDGCDILRYEEGANLNKYAESVHMKYGLDTPAALYMHDRVGGELVIGTHDEAGKPKAQGYITAWVEKDGIAIVPMVDDYSTRFVVMPTNDPRLSMKGAGGFEGLRTNDREVLLKHVEEWKGAETVRDTKLVLEKMYEDNKKRRDTSTYRNYNDLYESYHNGVITAPIGPRAKASPASPETPITPTDAPAVLPASVEPPTVASEVMTSANTDAHDGRSLAFTDDGIISTQYRRVGDVTNKDENVWGSASDFPEYGSPRHTEYIMDMEDKVENAFSDMDKMEMGQLGLSNPSWYTKPAHGPETVISPHDGIPSGDSINSTTETQPEAPKNSIGMCRYGDGPPVSFDENNEYSRIKNKPGKKSFKDLEYIEQFENKYMPKKEFHTKMPDWYLEKKNAKAVPEVVPSESVPEGAEEKVAATTNTKAPKKPKGLILTAEDFKATGADPAKKSLIDGVYIVNKEMKYDHYKADRHPDGDVERTIEEFQRERELNPAAIKFVVVAEGYKEAQEIVKKYERSLPKPDPSEPFIYAVEKTNAYGKVLDVNAELPPLYPGQAYYVFEGQSASRHKMHPRYTFESRDFAMAYLAEQKKFMDEHPAFYFQNTYLVRADSTEDAGRKAKAYIRYGTTNETKAEKLTDEVYEEIKKNYKPDLRTEVTFHGRNVGFQFNSGSNGSRKREADLYKMEMITEDEMRTLGEKAERRPSVFGANEPFKAVTFMTFKNGTEQKNEAGEYIKGDSRRWVEVIGVRNAYTGDISQVTSVDWVRDPLERMKQPHTPLPPLKVAEWKDRDEADGRIYPIVNGREDVMAEPIRGKVQNIRAISDETMEEWKALHDKYYQPSNEPEADRRNVEGEAFIDGEWWKVAGRENAAYDLVFMNKVKKLDHPPSPPRPKDDLGINTEGDKKDVQPLTIRNEVRGAHSGQTDSRITAVDADGNVVGFLDYSLYNGEASIQMIEVDESARGKGVATAMLDELVKEHDYHDIHQGMRTEDGGAFFQAYEQKRGIKPRPAPEVHVIDDPAVTEESVRTMSNEELGDRINALHDAEGEWTRNYDHGPFTNVKKDIIQAEFDRRFAAAEEAANQEHEELNKMVSKAQNAERIKTMEITMSNRDFMVGKGYYTQDGRVLNITDKGREALKERLQNDVERGSRRERAIDTVLALYKPKTAYDGALKDARIIYEGEDGLMVYTVEDVREGVVSSDVSENTKNSAHIYTLRGKMFDIHGNEVLGPYTTIEAPFRTKHFAYAKEDGRQVTKKNIINELANEIKYKNSGRTLIYADVMPDAHPGQQGSNTSAPERSKPYDEPGFWVNEPATPPSKNIVRVTMRNGDRTTYSRDFKYNDDAEDAYYALKMYVDDNTEEPLSLSQERVLEGQDKGEPMRSWSSGLSKSNKEAIERNRAMVSAMMPKTSGTKPETVISPQDGIPSGDSKMNSTETATPRTVAWDKAAKDAEQISDLRAKYALGDTTRYTVEATEEALNKTIKEAEALNPKTAPTGPVGGKRPFEDFTKNAKYPSDLSKGFIDGAYTLVPDGTVQHDGVERVQYKAEGSNYRGNQRYAFVKSCPRCGGGGTYLFDGVTDDCYRCLGYGYETKHYYRNERGTVVIIDDLERKEGRMRLIDDFMQDAERSGVQVRVNPKGIDTNMLNRMLKDAESHLTTRTYYGRTVDRNLMDMAVQATDNYDDAVWLYMSIKHGKMSKEDALWRHSIEQYRRWKPESVSDNQARKDPYLVDLNTYEVKNKDFIEMSPELQMAKFYEESPVADYDFVRDSETMAEEMTPRMMTATDAEISSIIDSNPFRDFTTKKINSAQYRAAVAEQKAASIEMKRRTIENIVNRKNIPYNMIVDDGSYVLKDVPIRKGVKTRVMEVEMNVDETGRMNINEVREIEPLGFGSSIRSGYNDFTSTLRFPLRAGRVYQVSHPDKSGYHSETMYNVNDGEAHRIEDWSEIRYSDVKLNIATPEQNEQREKAIQSEKAKLDEKTKKRDEKKAAKLEEQWENVGDTPYLILEAAPGAKTWMAEIVGPHAKYVLDRQFVREEARKGDRMRFPLNDGAVYEVESPKTGRMFVTYKDGVLNEVSKEDVVKYVRGEAYLDGAPTEKVEYKSIEPPAPEKVENPAVRALREKIGAMKLPEGRVLTMEDPLYLINKRKDVVVEPMDAGKPNPTEYWVTDNSIITVVTKEDGSKIYYSMGATPENLAILQRKKDFNLDAEITKMAEDA